LSEDDPVTVVDNVYEEGEPTAIYKGRNYVDFISVTENMQLVITPSGSHCPFLDGGNFNFLEKVDGVWMLKNWAERACVEFLEKVVLEDGRESMANNKLLPEWYRASQTNLNDARDKFGTTMI